MQCRLHNCITTRFVKCDQAQRHCPTCADYVSVQTQAPASAPPAPWRWISTTQLIRDSIVLASKLPLGISGIVGVPRSGLLPAATIATHLHVPLYTFEGQAIRRAHVGSSRGGAVYAPPDGPLVVIDDTTHDGGTLQRLRAHPELSRRRCLFGVVYAEPRRAGIKLADFHAVALPWPHLLEWNLTNSPGWLGHVAYDLDGIIVHDAESGGPVGTPYLLPRNGEIPLIATGRPESSRGQTEALLRSLGVRWKRLEMRPDFTSDAATNAEHKARCYREAKPHVFLESDPDQAERIWRLTGKAVICPRIEKVFQGPVRNTITVVVPTVSRPTLKRTLESLKAQPWQPGDEVLLVGDGEQPAARHLWNEMNLPGRYLEVPGPNHDWGHTPRNKVMPHIHTTHIAALDDDDVWTADALTTIRTAIGRDPYRPHLFRVRDSSKRMPEDFELRFGNVCTGCFVVPNGPRLGRYTSRYGGDFDFIRDTCGRYPSGLAWHDEVICVARPDEPPQPQAQSSWNPGPSPDVMSMDRPHLLWLHQVLTCRRYDRVLEIGCHVGYSTSAFLDAAKRGDIRELHLCDPSPTPELWERIAAASLGGRVVLHEERSVDLLARDCRWDFVFVDGDHSLANVAEEARLLIAAGAPMIAAHDTCLINAANAVEHGGPAILRARLQQAGYDIVEDCRPRTGEYTERGILFAVRDRSRLPAPLDEPVLPAWPRNVSPLPSVTVAIPHRDTPEALSVAVALWRKQLGVRLSILIVDTGSTTESLRQIESLRAADLQIIRLPRRKGWKHNCSHISDALDLAQHVALDDVLIHTHTDVFPRRRDFAVWMTSQASAASPAAGWRMSPRPIGRWRECVSHTATVVHLPTIRALGVRWDMDAYLAAHPDGPTAPAWPDTESGFQWTMERAGVQPRFLGDDLGTESQRTEWWDHVRSYTLWRSMLENGPERERAERDMVAALRDAGERLASWS